MNRYVSSYRGQLIGIGLLALLALLFILFVQAPSLSVPQLQRPVANEAALEGTNVDLSAGVHPADLKFYDNGYAIYRDATGSNYTLESVHPADRKFFTATYVWGAEGAHANRGNE